MIKTRRSIIVFHNGNKFVFHSDIVIEGSLDFSENKKTNTMMVFLVKSCVEFVSTFESLHMIIIHVLTWFRYDLNEGC